MELEDLFIPRSYGILLSTLGFKVKNRGIHRLPTLSSFEKDKKSADIAWIFLMI